MDDARLRAELGLRLAQIRTQRRLSQAQVGARAGLSHATISRVECGSYRAPMATLERIGTALGLSLWQFECLASDVRYGDRVLAELYAWGKEHRELASIILTLLGNVALDQDDRRRLIRLLVAFRNSLVRRAEGVPGV